MEGVITPDQVTLSIGSPAFSSKYVPKNVPIKFTPEFSIYGKDSHNYALEPHPKVSAIINPVAEIVSNKDDKYESLSSFNHQYGDCVMCVEAPTGVLPKNSRLIVQTLDYTPKEYKKALEGLDEDKK